MTECVISRMLVEKCNPKKPVIDMICPYHAIHFILSGTGYFNGRKLTAGTGFMVLSHEHVRYYPDPDDPWTYLFILFYSNDAVGFFKEQDLGYMVEPPYIFSFTREKDLLTLYDVYKSKIEAFNDTSRISSAMFRLVLSLNHTLSEHTETSPPKRLSEKYNRLHKT